MKLIEMDERITFSGQLEGDVGSVVVISKFNVKPEDIDQFLNSWASGAKIMKLQPGFISTQLSPRDCRQQRISQLHNL
jgi:hypothetical protein